MVGVACCTAGGASAGATTGLGAVTELEGANELLGAGAALDPDADGLPTGGAGAAADAVTDDSFDFETVPRVPRECRIQNKTPAMINTAISAKNNRGFPDDALLRYSFFPPRMCSARGSCSSGNSSPTSAGGCALIG